MKYIILIFVLAALILVAFAYQIEGVTDFTGIQIKATSIGTSSPRLEIHNQGVSQSFVIRDSGGTPEFIVNSAGGVTANSLTAAVLGASASGQKCVYGTQSISNTAAITHGLSTPVAVFLQLAADATGDGLTTSDTNSAAVVTAKVWNSAATPAAGTTPVSVAYFVCGTP